jgi:uncharacterized protein (DUF2236 family)
VAAPGYSATDPALQLWVNATLYDSAIRVHERVFGPLGPADADAVYADYAEIGVALQMPRALWPADREAFGRYWADATAGLRVDPVTRQVARTLLKPPTGPLWMRAAMPLVSLLTAGLLSPELRRAFALPWGARRQRRFDLVMGATALLYPRLPRALRHWPKNHLLRGVPHTDVTGRVPTPPAG